MNKSIDVSIIKIFKLMKFRMKIAFEAWSRNIDTGTLIIYAIVKTVQQKMTELSNLLKKIV